MANPIFANLPTTIFEEMSGLARELGAINLGQGFPDAPGPQAIREHAADAVLNGYNQYPPMAGLPELRAAVAAPILCEGDVLGAVLEGVCLEHRRHIERLQAALPQRLPVRLSGGATKSPVWCQRFADVLAVPAQLPPVSELGSVCPAALAGKMCSIFSPAMFSKSSVASSFSSSDRMNMR